MLYSELCHLQRFITLPIMAEITLDKRHHTGNAVTEAISTTAAKALDDNKLFPFIGLPLELRTKIYKDP